MLPWFPHSGVISVTRFSTELEDVKQMRTVIAVLLLVPTIAVAQDRDLDACKERQADVAAKAADFRGEAKIRRLIEFDLKRAQQEQAEGDAEECLEAIEHASNLLSGKY